MDEGFIQFAADYVKRISQTGVDIIMFEDDFEASTVSGWVIEILGEIPHAGKKLEYKKLDVEVLKSTVKKVLQVKVTVVERDEEEKIEEE